MLVIYLLFGLFFSGFYYCQALKGGLGSKRWALAGFVLGPIAWPMFCMQKRMKINKMFEGDYLVIQA